MSLDSQAILDFIQRWGLSSEQGAALQELLGQAPADDRTLLRSTPSVGPSDVLSELTISHTLLQSALMELPRTERSAPAGVEADRYQQLCHLGSGGMGDVYRVEDPQLKRHLALKTLRPEFGTLEEARTRFIEEAQVTAQFQHPGIIPVHDLGELQDGRPFYTMQEVRGRSFKSVIRELHQEELSQPALHQLMTVFVRICEAIGYAHAHGVIHRDLKPANILVGDHGRVLVVDWGLAMVVAEPRVKRETPWPSRVTEVYESQNTQVTGTPAYMAPEQANGTPLNLQTDVYALGCILFEILSGRPPHSGSVAEVMENLREPGPPPALPASTHGLVPRELSLICQRALRHDPEQRFSDAEAMVEALQAWQDGSELRRQALQLVERASVLSQEVLSAREEARQLQQEAEALLSDIPHNAPSESKLRAWRLEDLATEISVRAQLNAARREQSLQAALSYVHDLPEAHLALTDLYLQQHREAEEGRSSSRKAEVELRLRHHTSALPPQHERRVQLESYLEGRGSISLSTSPEGAEVELLRYREQDRRLVSESLGVIGRTPLERYPVSPGSYMLQLRAPGHELVRYPVWIGREQHWTSASPEGDAAVWLPPEGTLREGEIYVPGSWGWQGRIRSELMGLSVPKAWVWVDGFIAQRCPVTVREYLAFLNDLCRQGRSEEALEWVPREKAGKQHERGSMLFGYDAEAARFFLQEDADGDLWQPDWSMMMVTAYASQAYARWLAERDGKDWRLPDEWEWERAGRGVDGRTFPWGDHYDFSWGCSFQSQTGKRLPPSIDAYPADQGPYGLRHMAGTISQWTRTPYHDEGNPLIEGRLLSPTEEDATGWCTRGGSWIGNKQTARLCERQCFGPELAGVWIGFRLFRSLPRG